MDWSRIKTIFILTFLVLDVYLLYQFMEIHDANKYELVTEASVEEKLKAAEIQYGDLPKAPVQAEYLSAKPKMFTKVDVAKLKGQTAVILNPSSTISVTLDKPVQLNAKFEPSDLTDFLKNNILFGDHYQFWEKNDKQNTITYFEEYENIPMYQNINGMITFNLNGDNQIISYQQTYLEGIEKEKAKENDILPPLKAIETLHQKGMLKPKSKITKVELGYSTLIQLTGSQMLAPTWRIVVNDKENLFVNAFEGQIIQFNGDDKNAVE